MKVFLIILGIVFAVYILSLLVAITRQGRFWLTLTLTALSGLGSLLIVNLLSSVTGVGLTPTLFTLLTSGVFGLPGVVGMLLLKMFI